MMWMVRVYRLIFWCRSKCIRIQSPENRTNNNGSSYEVVAFTVSFLNPVAIEYAKKLVDCSLKTERSFYKLWYGSDRNDVEIN